jgi:hypothetical protein
MDMSSPAAKTLLASVADPTKLTKVSAVSAPCAPVCVDQLKATVEAPLSSFRL